VFLTGGDTSANACSAICKWSPPTPWGCLAAAATRLPEYDEAKLFRFMFKHSLVLACVVGLVVTAYAYVPHLQIVYK
jgi:hypothetical protein